MAGTKFSSIRTTGVISTQNAASLEIGYMDSTGSFVYLELNDLDVQDVLVEDQQNSGSPVQLIYLFNQSGTLKTHFNLPANGMVNVLATKTGYAAWTENIPVGELSFIRTVYTSLSSSITAANQLNTINLLVKLLQKTEAVSNAVNAANLPLPAVNITTTTTSSTGAASVENQQVELQLLMRILSKVSANREAIKEE